jgi:UDP-N-acetylmuramate-alanine ligase
VLATAAIWPDAANLAGAAGAGRLERAVITRAGAPVYVDYAHTPDAIESAIEALRPHAKGAAHHGVRRGRRPRRRQAAGDGARSRRACPTW